jgi:hypothetical protein
MFLFRWLWNGLRWLFGLLVPLYDSVKVLPQKPWLRVILRVLVIVAILAGLTFLNYWLDLEQLLRVPYPLLRQIWLPLVFVLAYLLVLIAFRLWQLLGPDPTPSPYPEIEAAWRVSLRRLERANVNLASTPVFLVLGGGNGPVEHLFAAAFQPNLQRYTPRMLDAPLQVFGWSEAVFVCCPEISLSAKVARLLAKPAEAEADQPNAQSQPPQVQPDPFAALLRLQEPDQPQQNAATSDRAVASGPLWDDDARTPGLSRLTILLSDADTRRQCRLQLLYLAQLIQQARPDLPPINGLLVLVPMLALDNLPIAQQFGAIWRNDWDIANEVLGVQCPVVIAVCDWHDRPGAETLIGRLSEAQRRLGLGQAFPLCPDLPPASATQQRDDSLHWLAQRFLPTLVNALLRLNEPSNAQLLLLLHDVWQRLERLPACLDAALPPLADPPLRYAGTWLVANGPDPQGSQGFAAPALDRLIQLQQYAVWSAATRRRDRQLNQLARLGLVGVAVVGLLLAGLFVWLLSR